MSTSLIIDGREVPGREAAEAIVNPATEDEIARVAFADFGQVDEAVRAARRAFDEGPWGRCGREERSRMLHQYADLLEKHADDLLATIINEAGATISLRHMHLDAPLAQMRWAAEMAAVDRDIPLMPDLRQPAATAFVRHLPAGVVAAITPYNAPLHAVTIKLAALLAAGCTVVIKASPMAPLTSLLLGRLALEAGLPAGVVNVVVADVEQTKRLIAAPEVDVVSFTGSVAVGRDVMAQASRGLKKVILELGGKNPSIILPDADLPSIMDLVHGRYIKNAGQGCGSTTRILVPADRKVEFLELSAHYFAGVTVGDPWDTSTVTGPVISAKQKATIDGYIALGVEEGGQVVARGGDAPAGKGFWVSPTLISGVSPKARISQEEIFGPVGVVLPYRDEAEAVAIANDSEYGLGASIYTADTGRAIELSARLRCGQVTINGGGLFRPDVPHGGFKNSGIGREYGEAGVMEFLETQAVIARM